MDVDEKEVYEDGIDRHQAVVKCVEIQTLVGSSRGALRSSRGLSAMGGPLLSEMLTKILIPVAMVIRIGFALLQWFLVSEVKVNSSTTSNGYNDRLLEEDSGSMSTVEQRMLRKKPVVGVNHCVVHIKMKDSYEPNNSNSSISVVAHLKNMATLREKGVVTKEVRLMIRGIRHVMTLRRRIRATPLDAFVTQLLPAVSDISSRLLPYFPKEEEMLG
ncbi:hypothetical protein SUGI_0332260 [Cryptomeria japonica]|nr:hypothetical protein SUGI_0332260 [Cryptomeria japonica]